MAKDVVRHPLDMIQHLAFQNFYPDEVSFAFTFCSSCAERSQRSLG